MRHGVGRRRTDASALGGCSREALRRATGRLRPCRSWIIRGARRLPCSSGSPPRVSPRSSAGGVIVTVAARARRRRGHAPSWHAAFPFTAPPSRSASTSRKVSEPAGASGRSGAWATLAACSSSRACSSRSRHRDQRRRSVRSSRRCAAAVAGRSWRARCATEPGVLGPIVDGRTTTVAGTVVDDEPRVIARRDRRGHQDFERDRPVRGPRGGTSAYDEDPPRARSQERDRRLDRRGERAQPCGRTAPERGGPGVLLSQVRPRSSSRFLSQDLEVPDRAALDSMSVGAFAVGG